MMTSESDIRPTHFWPRVEVSGTTEENVGFTITVGCHKPGTIGFSDDTLISFPDNLCEVHIRIPDVLIDGKEMITRAFPVNEKAKLTFRCIPEQTRKTYVIFTNFYYNCRWIGLEKTFKWLF